MINRYQHSAGDTYLFVIGFVPPGGQMPPNYTITGGAIDAFYIVVEFTSNTQYRWWAYFDNY